MLHLLPRDILRQIIESLDAMSIVRLESVCKEINLLRTPRLKITATPKRMRRGMQFWLDKNADRVSTIICLRTLAVPSTHTRCFIVRYEDVPPSLLSKLPTELVKLDIALAPGLTDLQRDTLLSKMTRLRDLTLGFGREHGPVRLVPPDGLYRLTVNCQTKVTVVSFPAQLRCLALRSKDGLGAKEPLPTSCKHVRLKCETPLVTLCRFFDRDTYEEMETLDINVSGMPSLMEVMSKMPRLKVIRCTANAIMVGDELVTSSGLSRIDLHARYCVSVGFVKNESVERLKSVRTVKAFTMGELFDFHEFFSILSYTNDDT